MKFLVLLVLVGGCALPSGFFDHKVTNLTPTRYPRTPTGIYTVTMEFTSNETALKHETIKAEVQVAGHNATYPMKRLPGSVLTNRWEAAIGPLKPAETNLFYRIKVSWKSEGIPEPRPNSLLEPKTGPRNLKIVD